MTPAEILAARALCDAATPGPWKAEKPACLHWGVWCESGYPDYTDVVHEIPRHADDGRFIAAARTGWPAALDEVERLREDNRKLSLLFKALGPDVEANDAKDAENDRLRATLAQPHMEWASGQHSVGVDIEAEDKRLRAEVERLRASLVETNDGEDEANAEAARLRSIAEDAAAWLESDTSKSTRGFHAARIRAELAKVEP